MLGYFPPLDLPVPSATGATLATLLDDLRDRLNDATDAQVSEVVKIRYLNFGIAATFPSLYRVVNVETITLSAGQYEYNLPGVINEVSRVFRVEMESPIPGVFWPVEEFQIIPGPTYVEGVSVAYPSMVIAFPGLPAVVGTRIRLFAAVPSQVLAVDADMYNGPVGTEEIPVLYAMGCIAGRRIDDRIDHRRYSSVAGQNGVVVETLEGAAQYWFNQFDVALEKAAMPLPGA